MGVRTHVEYGVIVDRTSRGLGYFLAETYRDLDKAKDVAEKAPVRFGYPAEVKRRTVTITDWQPIFRGGGES